MILEERAQKMHILLTDAFLRDRSDVARPEGVEMRFLSYVHQGRRGLGAALDGRLLGLMEDQSSYPGSLDDLVSAGGDRLVGAHQEIAASGEALDAAAISFLPPLARSSK